MSFSPETQKGWAKKALLLMFEHLGEKDVSRERFSPNDEPFSDVPITIWDDLEELGLIEPAQNIAILYHLTGRGWRKALELTGRLSSAEFKDQLGKISKVLKGSVKGRQSTAWLSLEQVARDANLAEDFVSNVIEANLLELELKQPGAEWENRQQKDTISVPKRFGCLPLDEL